MAVISAPHAFNEEDLYVDLRPTFGHSLYLKCEGFNFAGFNQGGFGTPGGYRGF